MTVVSNTGPLIALAKVDRLDILRGLFGRVLIPAAVQRELMASKRAELPRLEAAFARFINVERTGEMLPEVLVATQHLGDGEQEAIALARERQMTLLIDERGGREAARLVGVRVVGVAGVLLRAKEAGVLDSVLPTLVEMRKRGYWLSDELVAEVANLADELL